MPGQNQGVGADPIAGDDHAVVMIKKTATGSMERATAEVRGSKVVSGDKARTTEEQTGN